MQQRPEEIIMKSVIRHESVGGVDDGYITVHLLGILPSVLRTVYVHDQITLISTFKIPCRSIFVVLLRPVFTITLLYYSCFKVNIPKNAKTVFLLVPGITL